MATDVLTALIVIELSVAAVTFNATLFDVTPFCDALMLVDPTAAPVATPFVLMVATAVLEDVQITELVTFCVLPSVKVPVAVN